ncbi:MlaD family protein [Paraconexibacter antarcticus]|uniref:MlaD family protein n=1 Tax=Paraconexibacter antarcticus TaxID=2949664 RepID=A0ABY5DRE1_9ACTN|nr:MlaD family protein [Paraconexibacter antarcticus]UTI63255.1 MlaD family protein [Paraconexibacter antarcticus]
MKRLVTLGAVLALVAGAWLGAGAGGSSASGGSFRVDAIFDNAGFLVPGQDVKIAGAKVGTVAAIHLTPQNKARISMDVDSRFAPFRSDADCTIQPQSLIGEKFIQCTPGSVAGRPLVASGDRPPTVPLSGTHAPVDLDLVLSTFREPTTTRLSLLLSALGNGLAGHGTDLNEAIRRANPALEQTNQLLSLVNGDRRTIRSLISESDRVLTVLARRREDVARFVHEASGVTATTGTRRAELRATVRGLPALLDQARPALADLQSLARTGTPVVRSLGAAGPTLTRLLQRVEPFSAQALPTLNALGSAAVAGRATVKPLAPQLRRLRRLTVPLTTVSALTADLFQSTQQKGAVEGLLRFLYYAAVAQARYDDVGHILPAFPLVKDTCNLYATTTVKSCDAHFATGTVRRTSGRAARPQPSSAPPAARAPGPSTTPAPAPGAPSSAPAPSTLPKAAGNVLDGILGALTGRTPKTSAPPTPPAAAPGSTTDLLDYLLGR